MATFGRTGPDAAMRGIEEFWRWWPHAAEEFAQAVDGDYGSLPQQLADRVAAIDPDLHWELGQGVDARHALCLSAGGDATLRPLTERWLRAAPPADDVWEYLPARRADPAALDLRLQFNSQEFDLAETRLSIQIDEPAMRVAVTVHHPLFAQASAQLRQQISYLVLDWLLGEDDVERWLGEISTTAARLPDALPADALVETVRAMAQRHVEPSWTLLTARAPDGTLTLSTTMRPLCWIDHPLLDQHIAVSLSYPIDPHSGLPTDEALVDLRCREDELTSLLGPRALLVAHETARGRRVLHLYSDSTDPSATATTERWADQCPGAAVETHADPAWKSVRHLS
ncbi:MAG TPA: hypothetical protein VHW44_24595 [Pseudonocardiaceae bacterium]|jgi:hypothetical protein|nr:hypothetical protein [Pseudonocardiaceae bacterium]